MTYLFSYIGGGLLRFCINNWKFVYCDGLINVDCTRSNVLVICEEPSLHVEYIYMIGYVIYHYLKMSEKL